MQRVTHQARAAQSSVSSSGMPDSTEATVAAIMKCPKFLPMSLSWGDRPFTASGTLMTSDSLAQRTVQVKL